MARVTVIGQPMNFLTYWVTLNNYQSLATLRSTAAGSGIYCVAIGTSGELSRTLHDPIVALNEDERDELHETIDSVLGRRELGRFFDHTSLPIAAVQHQILDLKGAIQAAHSVSCYNTHFGSDLQLALAAQEVRFEHPTNPVEELGFDNDEAVWGFVNSAIEEDLHEAQDIQDGNREGEPNDTNDGKELIDITIRDYRFQSDYIQGQAENLQVSVITM